MVIVLCTGPNLIYLSLYNIVIHHCALKISAFCFWYSTALEVLVLVGDKYPAIFNLRKKTSDQNKRANKVLVARLSTYIYHFTVYSVVVICALWPCDIKCDF